MKPGDLEALAFPEPGTAAECERDRLLLKIELLTNRVERLEGIVKGIDYQALHGFGSAGYRACHPVVEDGHA